MQQLSRLASSLVLVSSFLGGTSAAQDQASMTTPTQWGVENNVPSQAFHDRVTEGYRPVDVEIESTSPLRVSGVFVHNSGEYQKLIQYDLDATWNQMKIWIGNGWRVVDVEPYRNAGGQTRYAYVAVRNEGDDWAADHDVETGLSKSQTQSWIAANPDKRITDIQYSILGGTGIYSFCWVENSGQMQSPWLAYLGVQSDVTTDAITQDNEARVLDYEPHWSSNRCSFILVPEDGNELDHAFRNLTNAEWQGLASSWGARITDFERSRDGYGDTRYSVVLRRNDNDLAFETARRMRKELTSPTGWDNGARSGLLLREFQGTHSTVAGVYEKKVMEPAGAISMGHHYAALRKINLGEDSFATSITVPTGSNGSCPSWSTTEERPFTTTLRDMMEGSDNAAIDAFRARYGTHEIETLCDDAGAQSLDLNHVVGCGCGVTPNGVTLRDLADLTGNVHDGGLGPLGSVYFEFMRNGEDFGRGAYDTSDAIDAALAGSSLLPLDRAALRNGIFVAYRQGSYSCGGDSHDRTIAAYVELPFRVGCGVERRAFFVGAWVNDALRGGDSNDAVGRAVKDLFRTILEDAVDSWENASGCFAFQNYGASTMNSSGSRAIIGAAGSRYILENDLTLGATGVPAGNVGMLLVSPEEGFVANPAGSAGNLLLGGPIGRDAASIQSASSTGTFFHAVDLGAVPTPTGPVSAVSGETLHFQWWFRDVEPTGAATSNSTDGVRVRLL